MTIFVALLRAVNVGGTGLLPMKVLKAACQEAGLVRVSTYIASGNIVFESGQEIAAVETLLVDLLRDRFALAKHGPVLRTATALAEAVARNPFADAAAARPNHLMVGFLRRSPPPGAQEALTRFTGPERLHLDGDHLYIDYAEGAARSKVTPAALDRALQTVITTRNWNTIGKLLSMARASSEPV